MFSGKKVARMLSEKVERKFIDTIELNDDFEILTDSGWQPLTHIHKTIEYDKWEIVTDSGKSLIAADTHILFDDNLDEIYLKDCIVEVTKIQTKDGAEVIKSVKKLDSATNMFDLTVESNDHRFYTNDILSHNSTVTIAYILWTVLFGPMQNIAILANKAATARDILSKLRLAYEHIPMWMQQGVHIWNKGSIELENGSKVIAAATASSSARGNTFNCVSGDSITKVKIDGEEFEISLQELYELISNSHNYERREYDDEVQYVHREQIQKLIHENSDKRLLTFECEIGEASYNSEEHGGLKFFGKFSCFANKTTHYLSQTFNKICNRRVQNKYDVCICYDDSYKRLSENDKQRVGNGIEPHTTESNWKESLRRNQNENVSFIKGQVKDTEASREYKEGLNWTKEIARACCKNQQESGKDTKNGRGASWYETNRRVEKKNERCCEGSCSLEQRKERNILSRSSRKNASGKTWQAFNRRTQREFEKIEVLTEKGYKDFCGIKRVEKQKVIKVIFQNGVEIVCTPEHKLFSEIGYLEAKDCLNEKILNVDGAYYEVVDIISHLRVDVYDLLEVFETNSYYCNTFLIKNCIFLDEFAFVPQNIAEEFITSVYPTISSGKTTKVIMVSTPNGMNLFYRFWTDAINKRNLYKPIEAHWSVVPGRDEKWAEDQIKQLGHEKFDQEFGCVSGDTNITTENGTETIESLFNKAERVYLVYKITREDGKLYIGTTIKDRIKNRISQHKNSERFKNFKFDFEILEESTSKDYIDMKEEYYINYFHTYNCGLNESVNGKGNHLCDKFTTFGFKFSKESRKRMSDSAKLRIKKLGPPNLGNFWSDESKRAASISRKGKISNFKIPQEVYDSIREEYESVKKKYVTYIAKNGKPCSSERQFAKEVSKKYNISSNMIVEILSGRVLR